MEELDTAALARLRETIREDYDEFLEIFKSESSFRLVELRRAIEEGNLEDARRLAHGLRSSAAWVGLQRLSATLADIEIRAEVEPEGLRERVAEAMTLRDHGIELIEREGS